MWEPYVKDIREHDGKLYALQAFAFTWGLMLNLNGAVYDGRFCFDTLQNAQGFYDDWDFKTYPVVGEDGCTAIKGEIL